MYRYDNELAAKQAEASAYADYYFRLSALAKTMFKWSGLPDSVNTRYLEECLFLYGRAVMFNDESMGYLALQAACEGRNVYNDPVRIQPISAAKVFKYYPAEEVVLIRNTPDMYPTFLTTVRYSQMLYDIDQTIDINVKAQKTPILCLVDQKQKQTLQAIYQKYNGNTPVIYGVKDVFDPNSFKSLKTDAPFVGGKLQDLKITKYNEYMNFLGIGMAEFKKERSITDEVQQFENQANALAYIGLSARQKAAQEMNEKFGLNVTVELSVKPYENEGSKSDLSSYVPRQTYGGTDITESGGED